MFSDRLTAALSQEALVLPEGPVLIIGAGSESNLSAFDGRDVTVVQNLQPDHDNLKARGFATLADLPVEESYGAVFVLLPRARALARLWIARAASLLDEGGILIVDGAKTDGADSQYRDCRKRFADVQVLSKAHGRMFWGTPNADFSDWIAAAELPEVEGFRTGAGLFSADHIDPGSAALVAALPENLKGVVADLGAGWGYLSAALLEQSAITTLYLVESDYRALSVAQKNLSDERAVFDWADATSWKAPEALDSVVMNPPFHSGRKGDPGLGRAFIASAAANLKPNGQLFLVANRHLPYEDTLTQTFKDVTEIGGTSAFKVLRAARPLKKPR